MRLLLYIGILLVVFASGSCAPADGEVFAGVTLGAVPVGGMAAKKLPATLATVERVLLQESLYLTLGSERFPVTREKLGLQLDIPALERRIMRVGRRGGWWQTFKERVRAWRKRIRIDPRYVLNAEVARAYFVNLKERIDSTALGPRLDLDQRKVIAGQPGIKLRVFDTMATLRRLANSGAQDVPLDVSNTAAPKVGAFDKLELGTVLGEFFTAYKLTDSAKDRTHNLKVAAAKLDGTILKPGEELSYNKKVGKRTAAQGYRMAAVITQGELIDGMAGGACQISSTLFGASFFAGLDLVSSRPHTIPSGYIKMGLDAAVAYPHVDLVIRNPYPFPVVIHFTVKRGRVRAQLLGPKRPWRKITFERTLLEELPFEELEREDSRLPKGIRVVAQAGIPGFKLERRRLFYGASGKKPVKSESRKLGYPPTKQIIKIGTGDPNPDYKAPKDRPPFGKVPPTFTLSQ
jgi:vancomycin resistance protein YoaR